MKLIILEVHHDPDLVFCTSVRDKADFIKMQEQSERQPSEIDLKIEDKLYYPRKRYQACFAELAKKSNWCMILTLEEAQQFAKNYAGRKAAEIREALRLTLRTTSNDKKLTSGLTQEENRRITPEENRELTIIEINKLYHYTFRPYEIWSIKDKKELKRAMREAGYSVFYEEEEDADIVSWGFGGLFESFGQDTKENAPRELEVIAHAIRHLKNLSMCAILTNKEMQELHLQSEIIGEVERDDLKWEEKTDYLCKWIRQKSTTKSIEE